MCAFVALVFLCLAHFCAARGRDILLLLDASVPITDAMRAEHAVLMLMNNYTQPGDEVSLHVAANGTITGVPPGEDVVSAACKVLRDPGGPAPSLYEFVVRAVDVFAAHRGRQQIAARDPVVFLISNGLFLDELDSESESLLQTLHAHWGCATSVVIVTRGDPRERAAMFHVARAGAGKVYATRKGRGPYELRGHVFGHGGRVLCPAPPCVFAPEWMPNAM